MKRRLSLLLCVILVAVTFTACGGQSGSGAESEPADTGATGTETAGGAIQKLELADIIEIAESTTDQQVYKDSTMDAEMTATPMEELTFTDEELAKIKELNLTIGMEFGQMSDPTRWEIAGIEAAAAELGINVGETWIAEDVNSQIADYQNFLTVSDKYDALLTIPLDVSTCGESLKDVMAKTSVGYMCSVPYNLDWNDPNFAGCSDANALQAGVYSAKALVKMLDGQGKIAEIGYKAGKEGTFASCYNRYLGWDSVLKDYPDIEVVDKWYDDPSDVKSLVESVLASNPDIKAVLVDWANTPGDQTQQVLSDLGLTPYTDITMVTIDYDDAIAIPMANNGPDNNYTSAFVTQAWYMVGVNSVKLFAKHELDAATAPKYVTVSPYPVATYNNLKTVYETAAPEGSKVPPEISGLTDQWELGVENIWK